MSESLQYGKYDIDDPSPGFIMGADTERPKRCSECLYGIYGPCIRRSGLCFIGRKKRSADG